MVAAGPKRSFEGHRAGAGLGHWPGDRRLTGIVVTETSVPRIVKEGLPMADWPNSSDPDRPSKADIMALLESDAMNKLAAYAARGRSHRTLSEQQLTDAWKQAFKNVANDPHIYEARAAENDLASEFQLRGLDPPYDEVKDDVQRFMSAAEAVAEDLRKDPDRLAQKGVEWMADLAAFKSARDEPKN